MAYFLTLADMGIGEISQTIDRREAVDLTYPHIIDDITFTSPPPKLDDFTSLFKPFDTNFSNDCNHINTTKDKLSVVFSGHTCYAGCVYSIIASNSGQKIQTIEDLANAQESGTKHLYITQELENF
ncbi:unnamed protein product [Oppiella nova]|uniref:Uncharacterized protein n=1 Tax=Oppiella nova TaxID=334625 RepID=A0A7R9MHR3_9ACAR|nr:unnamed protein product [Oppiella nova]CAG2177622.1 unnamed protein product [Oppiella nova]